MATKQRTVTRRVSELDAMNAKYGKNQLPAGFTAVTSFGVKWDYLNMPVLVGTVDAKGVRVIETIDPTTKKPRMTQTVSVITEDGEVLDVWESASLQEWFARVIPGAVVSIVFQGLRPPTHAGRSPMNVFVGSFKGEPPPVRDDAVAADARKAPKAVAAKTAKTPARKGARR